MIKPSPIYSPKEPYQPWDHLPILLLQQRFREFLDPKKKREIESWLEDSRIVDSLDESEEIEYFDTFPTLEEL
ncbi:hypothetical protein Tco_1067097 [Tanacetum coccineum]|uniref:Uncharacterized protein n=1 Tax=Tanacetum coccineum TaxID=301880 RepID=A0ABQ5HDN4_9ASTR